MWRRPENSVEDARVLARLSLAAMWLLRLLPLAGLARVGELFGLLLYALARSRRQV